MNNRPYLGIWFGNFFEPFYSVREAVRLGIADVAKLGFSSINLDSKPWKDFLRGIAARKPANMWRC